MSNQNFPETSREAFKAIHPESYWQDHSLVDIVYLHDDGNVYTERWLPVNGYEKLYAVSDLGRIKCLEKKLLGNGNACHTQKEKIKVQRLMPKGYLSVVLWNKQKSKHLFVHVLVATHFIPNPENKKQVNHKKGIKTDNRYFKIEWSTINENRQHAYDTGLQKPTKGILHGMSKLSNIQVMEIFNSKGSLNEIAKIFNVNFRTVSNIKLGISWSHITNKKYEKTKPINLNRGL